MNNFGLKLREYLLLFSTICLLATGHFSVQAQTQTVGLFLNDTAAYNGYTLFSPIFSRWTYLVDMHGREVHSWLSDWTPGNSFYLLENGDLLRTARITDLGFNGRGGRVERFDWDGNLIWHMDFINSTQLQHHDIEPMPNGNILVLAWDMLSQEEVLALGRDTTFLTITGELWAEKIIEVQPAVDSGGTIVWEWSFWDHLIQDFILIKMRLTIALHLNYCFSCPL